MRILYVDCFLPGDKVQKRLNVVLVCAQKGIEDFELPNSLSALNASELKRILIDETKKQHDILMISGHGHKSLTGFYVGNDPVRWHDLAFLLRGKLNLECTFIFYSCNGAFPGIMYVLGREKTGPDFVFGPTIKVDATIMANAVIEIIKLKKEHRLNLTSVKELVDICNKKKVNF